MKQKIIENWTKYFGVEKIKDITWAHAVNSQKELKKAMENDVCFIETDITIDKNGKIICAHPPNSESDLSLYDLIKKIKRLKIGLKADFKIPEVFYPALDILKKSKLRQPVILNADILQGNKAPVPLFNAKDFLSTCQKYIECRSNTIISPGWTTKENFLYTKKNIDQMIAFCQSLNDVTFPVRLSLLERSWLQIKRLLENPCWTLSVWSDADRVLLQERKWLDKNTDPGRIFLDICNFNKQHAKNLALKNKWPDNK